MLGTPGASVSYDHDNDGTTADIAIPIMPAFIEIKDDPKPLLDTVVEVSPPVFEDGGTQTATVKINLKAAATAPTTVLLKILEGDGKRDTDYEADLEENRVVIAEGSLSETADVNVIPIPDGKKAARSFKVEATVEGFDPVPSENISIVDKEGDLANIRLRATIDGGDPNIDSVGDTEVTITAYVIGAVSDDKIDVPLFVVTGADQGSAVRNVDYEVTGLRTLTIPEKTSSAIQTITITQIASDVSDTPGDPGTSADKPETIVVGSATKNGDGVINHAAVGDEFKPVITTTINLIDAETPTPTGPAEGDVLALVDEETDLTGTVGDPFSKDLPEASGTSVDEDSEEEYFLSGTLPAGLLFDGEARTISGTPTAEGKAEVEYIALVNGTNVRETYTITISEKPAPEINLEGIASTHTSIRENGGEASITLTVELEDAAGAGGEDVTLSIVTPTEGKAAHRDVDFDATLQGSITIEEGATSGTATLTVTPKDNTTADGHKAFGVQATSSSEHSAIVNIGISDNESASQGIALSVDPDEVSEGTSTDVTVTASLDGKASESNVTVSISIGASSSATRDVDYSAVFDGRSADHDCGRATCLVRRHL